MATPGKAKPTEPKPTTEDTAKKPVKHVKKDKEETADDDGGVESGPNPPDDRGL